MYSVSKKPRMERFVLCSDWGGDVKFFGGEGVGQIITFYKALI